VYMDFQDMSLNHLGAHECSLALLAVKVTGTYKLG
jgi:hypothetical protein